MSLEYQAKTTAKFPSICPRCYQRIRVGESIVQEENGKWSHGKICDAARKPPVRTEEEKLCTRTALNFDDNYDPDFDNDNRDSDLVDKEYADTYITGEDQ